MGCFFASVNKSPIRLPPIEEEEYEEMEDRDLDGRKHVVVGQTSDGMYSIDLHPESLFARLVPEPGNTAETEFRLYIKNHIPRQFSQDEYGNLPSVDKMELRQLAGLQSQLWREIPRAQAAHASPPEEVTRDDLLIAAVIDRIAETLAGSPHIFVFRENKLPSCINILCRKNDKSVVTLEPLLDITHFTPAHDLNLTDGRIFVFQSDGKDKYTRLAVEDHPLFANPVVLCGECLRNTWGQRERVWALARKFSRKNTPDLSPLLERPASLEGETQENHEGATIEDMDEALAHTPEYNNMDSRGTPLPKGLPQLDGAKKRKPLEEVTNVPTGRPFTSKKKVHRDARPTTVLIVIPSAIWRSVNNHTPTTMATSNPRPLYTPKSISEDELKLPLEGEDPTAGLPFLGTFDYPSVGKTWNNSISTPPPTPVKSRHNGLLSSASQTNSIPSPRLRPEVHLRGVSRPEILRNAERAVAGRLRREPNSPKSPKTVQFSASDGVTVLDILENDELYYELLAGPVVEPTAEPSGAKTVTTKSGQRLSKVATKLNLPVQTQASFSPPPPNNRPPPRFPKVDVPPAMSCFCLKPADNNMVQCANPDCATVKHHYKCLTKGQKLSSYHKKWTCDQCKFELQLKSNTNPQASILDFKLAFEVTDIVTMLKVPGPLDGVRDPYGFVSTPPVDTVLVQQQEREWARERERELKRKRPLNVVGDEDEDDDDEGEYDEESYDEEGSVGEDGVEAIEK